MGRVDAGRGGAAGAMSGSAARLTTRPQPAPHVRRLVASCLLLPAALGVAVAQPAPADLLGRLRQSQELSCRPDEPFFCANVHVTCAGRTTLPTFAFGLRVDRARGVIAGAAQVQEVVEPYEQARVEWDPEGSYVILRPQQVNGYLKLLSDGRYILRHYSARGAVMALGRCE